MTAALLLKAPVPGQVKTRLAADLGDVAACAAYRRLVEWQLRAIPPDWNIHLFHAPADASHTFRAWLGAPGTFSPQPDGNLGNRQQAAVETCLPDEVILIGGDCPYLNAGILRQAQLGLGSNDLSLVPAVDGGYVALAMRQWHPGLFEGIAWSTKLVADQLRNHARELGLTMAETESIEDVDTLEQWQRACAVFPGLNPGIES